MKTDKVIGIAVILVGLACAGASLGLIEAKMSKLRKQLQDLENERESVDRTLVGMGASDEH